MNDPLLMFELSLDFVFNTKEKFFKIRGQVLSDIDFHRIKELQILPTHVDDNPPKYTQNIAL